MSHSVPVESLEPRTLFAAGAPDVGFGNFGVVTVGDFTLRTAGDVVAQPDGKIVAIGASSGIPPGTLAVWRLTPGGAPDPTFDGDGKTQYTVPNSSGVAAECVTLQPDGKILAGFTVSFPRDSQQNGAQAMLLARYNLDGTPDLTFHGDGRLLVDDAPHMSLRGVQLRPDGRILMAGVWNDTEVVLQQVLPDGTPDVSFGNGSRVIDGPYTPTGLAVDAAGRILVPGLTYVGYPSPAQYQVHRLTAAGQPDPTFGPGGAGFVVASTTADGGGPIQVRPDGSILSLFIARPAGQIYPGAVIPTLVKLLPTGAVDPAFAAAPAPFQNADFQVGGDFVVQGDGRIVLAGGQKLTRFRIDGTVDPTFGQSGVTVSSAGTLHAVALQNDNKVLVAGDFFSSSVARDVAGIARYTNDAPAPAVPVVTGLLADGSKWSTDFRTSLDLSGQGDGGAYVLPPAPPPLPWGGLDRFSVRFSGPVVVETDDLRVRGGSVPLYGVQSVAFDAPTFTATWTLSQPVGLDKLLLEIPAGAVTDPSGNPLGAYSRRLDVVPGDINGTARVDGFDTLTVKAKQGKRAASDPGSYPVFFDYDGNGRIDAFDTLGVKARQGTNLNQVPAAPSPGSLAAAVGFPPFGATPIRVGETDELSALLR